YMEMDPSAQITVEKPDISKLTDIKTVYDATEVIKTAFTTNPDIKLAELQQQIYKQAIKVAQGAYYPTLVAFAGLGSSYSNQAQTVTGQTINGTTTIGTVEGTGQNVVVPNVVQTLSPVSFGSQLNN